MAEVISVHPHAHSESSGQSSSLEEKGQFKVSEPEEKKASANDDDDDEEDVDALITALWKEDDAGDDEEQTAELLNNDRSIAEGLLQTDIQAGLTEQEVQNRRRRYGMNKMKEEKRNHLLRFLLFFVGPVQFVMEVRMEHPVASRCR